MFKVDGGEGDAGDDVEGDDGRPHAEQTDEPKLCVYANIQTNIQQSSPEHEVSSVRPTEYRSKTYNCILTNISQSSPEQKFLGSDRSTFLSQINQQVGFAPPKLTRPKSESRAEIWKSVSIGKPTF